jgi:hypothetical protein
MGIVWTIIIGFVAGLIAKFLLPGPNEPSGFIVTTLLGPSLPLSWDKPSVGTKLVKALD